MNIYVETNFILELALLQEQCESCDTILAICETDKANLILPAFSITEAYKALIDKHRDRRKSETAITNQLTERCRSKPYTDEAEALKQMLVGIIVKSIEAEKQQLYQVTNRILACATIIPLTQDVLLAASSFEKDFGLPTEDSIVYASVINYLTRDSRVDKCFINKNIKDFDDPDVIECLEKYGCKILLSFKQGCNYIQHRIRS